MGIELRKSALSILVDEVIGECAGCRYANPGMLGSEDDPVLVVECRRYPPVVIALDDQPMQLWPQVEADAWCGEWSPTAPFGDPVDPAPGPDEAFPDELLR